jgi:hypothetical protein
MGLQLPGQLVTILQELGYNWPEADEEKLFDLGGAWLDFHPGLAPIVARLESAGQRVWSENMGDAVEAFRTTWTAEDGALASLRDSVGGTQMVGPLVMVAAAIVLALKINVIIQLTVLLIQIIQAIATAGPTFGASLLEIPVFKEITSRLVNLLIGMAMEAVLG